MNYIIELFAGIDTSIQGQPINFPGAMVRTLSAQDLSGIVPNVSGQTSSPSVVRLFNAETDVRAEVEGDFPAPIPFAQAFDPNSPGYQAWMQAALDVRLTEARLDDPNFIMLIDFNGQGPTLRQFYFEWSPQDLLEGTATINGFEVDSNGAPITDPVAPINLIGDEGDNTLNGDAGNDILRGAGGDDQLNGNDGADTLDGGTGDDLIFGGATERDLRDVIFGGAGNDTIDAGYGNDSISGGAGHDVIAGGFGADTVIGNQGDDTLTGSAFGDLIFGGDGTDFINGGFGHDRVNGGSGGDTFYHLGIADHGSDWIQDFTAGDTLFFGNSSARIDQFQVNIANTANAGAANVDEAFVIYRPTGQIIWALVDGAQANDLTLRIGDNFFDLS